eukprot:g2148.t1
MNLLQYVKCLDKELRTLAIAESCLYLIDAGESLNRLVTIPLCRVTSIERQVNSREIFGNADLDILRTKLPGEKDQDFGSAKKDGRQSYFHNTNAQIVVVEYVVHGETRREEIALFEKRSELYYHLRCAWHTYLVRWSYRRSHDISCVPVDDDDDDDDDDAEKNGSSRTSSRKLSSPYDRFHKIRADILTEQPASRRMIDLLNELTDSIYFDRKLKLFFLSSKILLEYILVELNACGRRGDESVVAGEKGEAAVSSKTLRYVYHLLLLLHAALFNSHSCCTENRTARASVADMRSWPVHRIAEVLSLDFCRFGALDFDSLSPARRQWWTLVTSLQVATLLDVDSIVAWTQILRDEPGDAATTTTTTTASLVSTLASSALMNDSLVSHGRDFVRAALLCFFRLLSRGRCSESKMKERARCVEVWRFSNFFHSIATHSVSSWKAFVHDHRDDVFKTNIEGVKNRLRDLGASEEDHWTSRIFGDVASRRFDEALAGTSHENSEAADRASQALSRLKSTRMSIRKERLERRRSSVFRRLSLNFTSFASTGSYSSSVDADVANNDDDSGRLVGERRRRWMNEEEGGRGVARGERGRERGGSALCANSDSKGAVAEISDARNHARRAGSFGAGDR